MSDRHTTHFDDCGCLSARLRRDLDEAVNLYRVEVSRLHTFIAEQAATIRRVQALLGQARAVSPSDRQTVYVTDVQAALDGDQAHVGPRKTGQNDTTTLANREQP